MVRYRLCRRNRSTEAATDVLRSGGKQSLTDEPAAASAGGAGEQAAADMRDELIQHVELRHLLEQLR